MLCQEGPEKVHLSFWQKTLVSILRVFLKSKNKTNYIFEISMKNTTKYDIFRIHIQNLRKKNLYWVNLSEFWVNFLRAFLTWEENQIHIWNQHAKNYQMLLFENFDQKSLSPLKGLLQQFWFTLSWNLFSQIP